MVTLFLFNASYESGFCNAQDDHSNCCGYGVMRYIITNTYVRSGTKPNRTEQKTHHITVCLIIASSTLTSSFTIELAKKSVTGEFVQGREVMGASSMLPMSLELSELSFESVESVRGYAASVLVNGYMTLQEKCVEVVLHSLSAPQMISSIPCHHHLEMWTSPSPD